MDKETIIVILVSVLVIMGVTFGAIALSKASCLKAYSSYEPKWGNISGCRVMWNGKLTPVDIIREIN